MYISTLTIAKKANMTNNQITVKCQSIQIGKPYAYTSSQTGNKVKVLLVTPAEYKQHLRGYIQRIKAKRKEKIIPKHTRTKLDKLMVAFGVPTVFAPN